MQVKVHKRSDDQKIPLSEHMPNVDVNKGLDFDNFSRGKKNSRRDGTSIEATT